MKKIIFVIILLASSFLIAQTKAQIKIDEYMPKFKNGNASVLYNFVAADSSFVPANVGNDSLGYGTNTVTTVEVLGGDILTKKITVVNYTTGSILFVGSNNSVTAVNGMPLNYLDAYTMTVSNLNKVWLISDSSTDVRYSYEN